MHVSSRYKVLIQLSVIQSDLSECLCSQKELLRARGSLIDRRGAGVQTQTGKALKSTKPFLEFILGMAALMIFVNFELAFRLTFMLFRSSQW